jgi:uncharacterized protein (DUF1697 family)
MRDGTLVHVALLRAVNVGGKKPITMSEVRNLLTELGFDRVRSLLQSGNLIFQSKERTGIDLEDFLEKEAAKRLNLHTEFLVRTAEEWERIIADNPFRDEAKRDAAHLVVMFLKQAPSAKDLKVLQAAITGPEIVSAEGRQAYIVYPAGIGRSRLTHALVEKRLGTRGTSRNWSTILKLATGVSEASHFADDPRSQNPSAGDSR